MLRHLHVRNLAVIEDASVDFSLGLNIVTGSTGAGKSLVVDALALLAGARASADTVRTGASKLIVTGVFVPSGDAWREQLSEAGVECEDEELVVRREVSATGRGRVFLNDQPTTLRLLSRISDSLLRIFGQREELGLTTPDLQRQWLDLEGGEEAVRLLDRCALAYHQLRDAEELLERLTSDDRSRHERLDLLRYQSREIEEAQVSVGEEEDLRARRDRLRHAEKIQTSLQQAVEVLSEADESASPLLSRAVHALRQLEGVEPDAGAWCGELEELRIRVDDLAATLRAQLDGSDEDPGNLDQIEDRLALLERLFRKYAPSSAEVLELAASIEQELSDLEGSDERIAEAVADVARLREQYQEVARQLSEQRRRWARSLSKKVESELGELALAKSRFEIEVRTGESAATDNTRSGRHPWGIDRVTYRFSPNPGEELRALAKVASGGELARIYLALQVAAMGVAREDTSLVFDEVDAGIGGQEATAVGRKLRQLAESGQILAVTHLPQVAAFGHSHLRVRKSSSSGRTGTRVQELQGAERVDELARMLGGETVTELSRQHAQELLQHSNSTVSAKV